MIKKIFKDIFGFKQEKPTLDKIHDAMLWEWKTKMQKQSIHLTQLEENQKVTRMDQ